jgi:hypothetical protein
VGRISKVLHFCFRKTLATNDFSSQGSQLRGWGFKSLFDFGLCWPELPVLLGTSEKRTLLRQVGKNQQQGAAHFLHQDLRAS